MMRVILAAIFVFGSMLGTIGVLEAHFPNQPWPWWTKPLPALVMLTSLFVAAIVFNRSGYRPSLRRRSLAEQVAELERKGLLVRQSFQARRAFGVEEFEDEGSHYYLELADGRVLYLNGQYLYDYEPIADDPEVNQYRSFPCTEFVVLRHREAGYVVHIQCAGTVLEPEIMAAPFTRDDVSRGIPEDGQIITELTYEAIKADRAALA